MVWEAFSIGGRTDLYVVRGRSLIAVRYRDEIFTPIVISYAGAVGKSFILMDDNAQPHRVYAVNNMLNQQGIQQMN